MYFLGKLVSDQIPTLVVEHVDMITHKMLYMALFREIIDAFSDPAKTLILRLFLNQIERYFTTRTLRTLNSETYPWITFLAI